MCKEFFHNQPGQRVGAIASSVVDMQVITLADCDDFSLNILNCTGCEKFFRRKLVLFDFLWSSALEDNSILFPLFLLY
jgi:hypothetical protein